MKVYIRVPYFMALAAALLWLNAGTPLRAQEEAPIPRAIPVEPITPRAVPFDQMEAEPATDESGTIRLAPAGTEGTRTSDEMLFDAANGLYSRKMYDYAAAEYEKLLAGYPQGPLRQPALFRLAECYRVAKRPDQARAIYERLLMESDRGEFVGPAAFRLASIYYEAGNPQAALPLFQRAASLANARQIKLASRFYEAKCLEQLNRNVETMEVYKEIVSVSEDNPYLEASRRAFADKASNFGRLTDALEQYEILMKTAEQPAVRAEAALQAALLAQQLQLTDKALAAYEEALSQEALGESRGAAQVGYFQLMLASGNVEKLLEEYEKRKDTLAASAGSEVMLARANALRQKKQYTEAAAAFAELQKRYPSSAAATDAAFQSLVADFYAGDSEIASKVDRYLKTNPPADKAAQAQLIKAETLFKKEDWRGAGAAYAGLLDAELPPKQRGEMLFKLGWCYARIDNQQRVIEVMTEFIQDQPDHDLVPSALAQRGFAYQQQQRFDEAVIDFSKILGNYPKSKERPFAYQQKALVLGQQGDNAGMIQHFSQLLKEFPDSTAAPQANYWTGWAYFEAKDYARAIPFLDQARKLDAKEYGDRAGLRIILSNFYLENLPALAAEVDAYIAAGYQPTVPVEVVRFLGTRLLADGDAVRAEKYLADAVAQGGTDPDLILSLARVQTEAGYFDRAATSLNSYLAIVKDPVPQAKGYLLLGEAKLGSGKTAEATKAAEEVMRLQPEGRLNAEGRIMLGRVELADKRYDQAAKSFLSVAVLYEDVRLTPMALNLAIQAFAGAGNNGEVNRLKAELRTRYPDFQSSL